MLAIGRDGKAIGVVAILIRICVSYLEKDYYCNRANYVASCNCRECRSVSARLSKQSNNDCFGSWRVEKQKLICYLDHNGLKTETTRREAGLVFSHPNQVSSPTKSFQEKFSSIERLLLFSSFGFHGFLALERPFFLVLSVGDTTTTT